MQYKTIVLELLQQRPELHEQLRKTRRLLPTLETLRQGTEGQPRSLEGNPLPGEAGQRPEPDRERGTGDGPQGTGGSFALRVSSGRERSAFARPGNGVHPKSHVARLKASRQQPSLFDSLPDTRRRRHPHRQPAAAAPADAAIRRSHPPTRRAEPDRHPSPSPAARKPRPATSSPPSARSRPSSRSSGRPRRKKSRRSPASPASGRSPCRSSPIRSPAATRMPAGRPWARS